MSLYKVFVKRLFDIIISFFTLLIFSPLICFITILIMLVTRDNPFYFQKRPGKNTKIFNVFKFKTMNNKKDEKGKLLPDNLRITSIGKFIRAYSIDEIPQLINVLLGDMSIIGPRPLLVKYLPLYSKNQLRRHDVRPGITGWAQVNGRNNISWNKKFELDVWYVNNLSFFLDCKILIFTIKKVLFKHGVSKEGFATTDSFDGFN